jgi:hypothetical protein
LDTHAGPSDRNRMEHLGGLVKQLRGSVVVGEPSPILLVAVAAQAVAWCAALDEAAECRVETGEAV